MLVGDFQEIGILRGARADQIHRRVKQRLQFFLHGKPMIGDVRRIVGIEFDEEIEIAAGEGYDVGRHLAHVARDGIDRRVGDAGQRHRVGIDAILLGRPLRSDRIGERAGRQHEILLGGCLNALAVELDRKAVLARRHARRLVEALRQRGA